MSSYYDMIQKINQKSETFTNTTWDIPMIGITLTGYIAQI